VTGFDAEPLTCERCTVDDGSLNRRPMLKLAILVGAAAALALAGTAAAKNTRLTVSAPTAPKANVPWTLTVRVSLDGRPYAKAGYRPTLYLIRSRYVPVATFHATKVAPGTYRVRVVFPQGGKWRYTIPDPVQGDWSFTAPRVAA
jgi:hypothetical protein